MANNRIYLICKICEYPGPFEDIVKRTFFAIAKWYPGSGWGTNREDNESFNQWLEFHSHDQEFPFRFEYEVHEIASELNEASKPLD